MTSYLLTDITMPAITIRNVPAETHRALKLRAAQKGHSTEAEIREILEEAARPSGRLKLGSLLAEIGREARLSESEWDIFEKAAARDHLPVEPITFD